ncbi:hypothetical protein MJO29_007257 [Puccinia striiformis f. sp. tritici]|nr:hypothetical protein MJO29_007257 [Puccinia striiformis f. sp. tritici]
MTSIKKEQARYLQQITSKSSPPSSEDQPSIDQMSFNLMTHILTKFKDTSSEVDQHAAITVFDTALPNNQLQHSNQHA